MSNILIFKPKENGEARKQVEDFIALAKKLSGFDKPGAPLDWSKDNWSHWLKGVNFAKSGENIRSKEFDPESGFLDAGIIDFAKAYVLYQKSHKRTAEVREIVALRYLESALVNAYGHADVTLATARDFDRAAQLCQEKTTSARAYRIGAALEKLARFLSDKMLTVRDLHWSSTIPRPNDARGHRKNKQAAEKKMPSPQALDAIAEIWSNNPESLRDIFTTSNCVLLVSQPSRVGELNLIPADCLPPDFNDASFEAPSDQGEEMPPLFVKWFSEKGYGHTKKPIPTVMVPSFVEAVRRLRSITEGPRRLAKFLEENPNDFPSHDRCPKVTQDSVLTSEQVLDALCLMGSTKEGGKKEKPRNTLKIWLNRNLKYFAAREGFLEEKAILREALDGMFSGYPGPGKEDHHTLTLRKLNVVVRARYLPEHFPYVDEKGTIKFQNALNCYFVGQLGKQEDKGHGHLKPYIIRSIENNTLNLALTIGSGEYGSKKSEVMNIFRRWGYTGEEYRLTTHQFRHYLHTLGSRGNVGETELSRWAGRLDIRQNKVYNHRSDEEMVGESRAIGFGEQKSNLIAVVSSNEPIMASDVADMVGEDRVVHRTLIGVCIHDFAMEPCQKDRDCLGCKEHVCIKGDEERLRRLKISRDGLEESLAEAQKGMENEYFGADKWVADRLDRLKRTNELIAILQDPEIEDGAVIGCTDTGYLPIRKALEANGKLETEEKAALGSDQSQAELAQETMRELLER